MPSPRPSSVISRASASGFGSMCGRAVSRSAIVSMSKNADPGICPCPSRNSALPIRPVGGRCQEASITPRSGFPSSAASSSVEQKLRESMAASRERWGCKGDPHAPIDSALLFNLCDGHAADLARPGDMGPAARLEVEALDRDEADFAGPHRRLHRHRFHKPRIGLELLVRDPAAADRDVARDDLVEPPLDIGLVEGGFARVEIEPPLAVADRAARDRVGQDDSEKMQRGVRPHAFVTEIPIDLRTHAGSGRWERSAMSRQVQDRSLVRIINRASDLQKGAVIENERAPVARLTAALRVKDRAVERDALLSHEHDPRGRLAKIGVVAKESLSHWTNACGARALASSQSGTGRFLERRKAGLNSLDA